MPLSSFDKEKEEEDISKLHVKTLDEIKKRKAEASVSIARAPCTHKANIRNRKTKRKKYTSV